MERENWDDCGMGAFGEQLRRQREKRGVSLGEISESTKISVSFLRALEQEDFERLPGGVFNRGFVRAYCKFVDIDDEPIVAEFDAAVDAYRAAQSPAPEQPAEAPPKYSVPFPNSPIALVALAASVLLLICIAFWWHSSSKKTAGQTITSAERRAPERHPISVGEEQAAASSTTTVAQSSPAPEISSAASTPSVAAKPEIIEKAVPPETAPRPRMRAPIRVAIYSNEDSWLSVVADGRVLMEGILPAQNSKVFRAQKNMIFKTGNAGGLELSYNGKALPPLGTNNEFKSLTFTSDGPQQ